MVMVVAVVVVSCLGGSTRECMGIFGEKKQDVLLLLLISLHSSLPQ
jgi:hypothetical protein